MGWHAGMEQSREDRKGKKRSGEWDRGNRVE